MRKILLVLLLITAILLPQGTVGADSTEELQVKQLLETYFDLRNSMLSSLEYDPQIKDLMEPGIQKTGVAVTEADVLDTILRYRKLQVNDLRFERYKADRVYEKIEVAGDQAWAALTETVDLYYRCAPTVKNSTSVAHAITLKKVNGKWCILKDEYEEKDGIKQKLLKLFIEKQISLEEAKKLVLSESESQINSRIHKLADMMQEIKEVNPVLLFVGKPIAYAGGTAGKIDTDIRVIPVVEDERTLIPLRFIAEKLGAQVQWDESTATAEIKNDLHKIEITLGENSLKVDGKKITLDVPAKLMQDRVMVPLRAVTDAFGKKVLWDERGLILLSDQEVQREKQANLLNRLADFYEVLFTKTDFPRIDGSTATYPLSIEMGKELLGLDDTGAKGFLTHKTTHNAYVNLIQGNADIIFVTQPSPEEENLASDHGVSLEVVPICNEGFVFLVNKENPVKNLTARQVEEIYQGKIRNWKEVGGANNEIIPYQREANSGSQTIMENTVMKEKKLMEPPKEQLVYGMGELIDRVADYSNAKNALGYSVYYYATQMYSSRAVKILNIDGVEPAKQTIRDGSYPFTVGYYAVLRKDEPQNSSARKLLRWMLGEEGQGIVDRAGLVPVK